MNFEQLQAGCQIEGLVPGHVVQLVAAIPAGSDSVTVIYRLPDGGIREQMVFKSNLPSLRLAVQGRSWVFDSSADEFKLVLEAYRIDLAFLFDPMMAVHTSNVLPLPHQITAVYEAMLPRQPLRFVLADDPGSGKTIMAGLLIQELLLRADSHRIMIVAPGSLVEQWQDELDEKFGLKFKIFSRDLVEESRLGNPFEDYNLLIARLDQLSRSQELQEKLSAVQWDLVVVDEAHKMAAHWFSGELKETQRFKLGKALGATTRHYLLMTATPHNGKEEDFQTFLSLLDTDRFYGKFRYGAHKVDISDLMRRMVKEELLTFEGNRLFPPRRAYTANYELSDLEAQLYFSVTQYVREEMNKADNLDGKRRGTVGFALTSLQRRLASSPEAIYQSLKRRRKRLISRLEQEKTLARGQSLSETATEPSLDQPWELQDELSADEFEILEQSIVEQASAARTIEELQLEISSLEDLEKQAYAVVHSEMDRKWEELSRLLRETPEMRGCEGLQRKLIIFTEHRDTLNYLVDKIRGSLGIQEAVVAIHGGVRRDDRRKIQESFRNDPAVLVLVATDAAGEGVNLQVANLMVNYDLPWNPNRLEQRFGRIHRIGQTEVCHLWNLVASGTREGAVFRRLFDKLEIERQALGGRVFDVLGEVFENESLQELLKRAIQFGEDPEVRAKIFERVDGALDQEHLRKLIQRGALCEEVMDEQRLYHIRDEMEKAKARKLQPHFIQAFFRRAFREFGGDLKPCETDRFEIKHVPPLILERDRQISGRNRRMLAPVSPRYERVCFKREAMRVASRPNAREAVLLHPGHPLIQATLDLVLERHRPKLRSGTVLIDRLNLSDGPRLLFLLEHIIKEGSRQDRIVSRRLQFVFLSEDGSASDAGFAPHLDLEPPSAEEQESIQSHLQADWLNADWDVKATEYASGRLAEQHFHEIQGRRQRYVDKVLAAVQERLYKELSFWQDRQIKLDGDLKSGLDVRVNMENVKRRLLEMSARLETRQKELNEARHVISTTPTVIGGALVIPAKLAGLGLHSSQHDDVAARQRVEKIAMEAVMRDQQAWGRHVVDVSQDKCGWDVTASDPTGSTLPWHIEVKGRHIEAQTITVTRNEILYALNQGEVFVLAIVLVRDDDAVEGPFYLRDPFENPVDWATVSVDFTISKLIEQAKEARDVARA